MVDTMYGVDAGEVGGGGGDVGELSLVALHFWTGRNAHVDELLR